MANAGSMQNFYGMYRAKVVNNKDPEKFGRVIVYIPDTMPDVEHTNGLWARPANNPLGGRNMEEDAEHHFAGSCYIPKIGSWLWIFFENGNPNKPYYFAACDLENAKVPPENQSGSNYEDKWTIIKTHDGRIIHVSDDPDDARIEITGRKRNLGASPSGDGAPVYDIDGNCTTILLDEREGKEKLLIRTHKGDYFHIDIDEQKLQAYFKSDINIQTEGDLNITVKGNYNREVEGNESVLVVGKSDISVGQTGQSRSRGKMSISSADKVVIDGSPMVRINSGDSIIPDPTKPTLPQGERST